MEQSVSLSKIKRSIYDLRKEIANINGESPTISHKKLTIYMWKGIRVTYHNIKGTVLITLAINESYDPIPDSKYILLLIRDELVREKQLLTRELINKITDFNNE